MLKETKMKEKLFDYYYGSEGKEKPSDEDIEKYVNDNYLRFKSITIDKSTKTDEDEKKKENEEKKTLAEEYLKKASSASFSSFDSVIEEYNKYVEEKNKAASGSDSSSGADSSSSSSSSTADSSSSADSSSTADSLSTADSSSSKVGDTDSSSQAGSSSQADSSSQSDSSSQADSEHDHDHDSSAAEGKTAQNKYPNESMINYALYTEETLKTESGKALVKIKEMSEGKAELFENEDGYHIIIKGDVKERTKEYISENHDNIVKEMFEKTFDETIAKWAEELDIKVDNNSIKRYTAKKLYNKYTEFTNKNNKTNQ